MSVTRTSGGDGGGMAGRWAAQRGSIAITNQLLAVAATALVTAGAMCLVPLGVGVLLLPACADALRRRAGLLHDTSRRFTGIEFALPELPERGAPGFVGAATRCRRLLTDRAFRQLVRWAVVAPLACVMLAFAPVGLVLWGLFGVFVVPILYLVLGSDPMNWYAFVPLSSPGAVPFAAALGGAFAVFGFLSGAWWLRVQARWCAGLLNSDQAQLRSQVSALAASRDEVRHDAAAELRRIERDVHDGAQAQLVAIGMKLGAAQELMDTDAHTAMTLIGQAREDSSTALNDLRDLMRGIRPPVLADRGLAAALEAIAIESALPVGTDIRLPVRLDPALEAAAYFGTRELLTNAAKHSAAAHVWLFASVGDGVLRIVVRDDGRGAAVITPGGGLDGVRRRLAAFDGTLSLSSPAGGPTEALLEVPCASS